MSNVVDSSVWIEYFRDGPTATQFEVLIDDRDGLIVPTIVLYEVTKVVRRLRGDMAADEVAVLMQDGRVVDLDAALALDAAQLSIDHGLAMADSIILATARRFGATLWTQDIDFADIDGVRYIAKT